MTKTRVGVLFGGRSGEHEVSLRSAASVIDAIDKQRYEVVPLGITKAGRWLTGAHAAALLSGRELGGAEPAILAKGAAALHPPAPGAALAPFETAAVAGAVQVDVIFPVLHGTFGEDGTIQGLLELANIAYVGAGVLGSAAGMDKEAMKCLFRAARLPIVKHVTVLRHQWRTKPREVRRQVESALRYPVFVKPANLGSSVGISKVRAAAELAPAMDEAALYDRKLVIEQGVGGKQRRARELECAVLGNDQPRASVVGEVVPCREFYDYQAKYIDDASELIIPAKLNATQRKTVQTLAVAAFRAVDCAGLGRVDFLMDPGTGKIYLNEINTMPGFTSISMYPKLWQASGISYAELIRELLELALARHADKQQTRFTRD